MKAEVVVLGMGPGGEEVAERLAEAGVDVVGIEKELVGGECPYWACIPTKMMVRGSNMLAEAARMPQLSGDVQVTPRWSAVADRIRADATDDWDDTAAVARFEGLGGRFVRGAGRLDGPARVVVGDDVVEASRAVVIATGTRPVVPFRHIDGLSDVPYWTNRDAVKTTTAPSSLVVIGGGVVGCEFAQVFARYGARVVIIEGSRHLLPSEEVEACQLLHDVFAREGIEVCTGASAKAVAIGGDGVVVTLDDGSTVTGAHLLVATGRQADLDAIGATTIGVPSDARWIRVDDHLRVDGVDGVYAIGDVTGGGFTHIAVHHARIVIDDILGRPTHGHEHHAVPRVAFTDPEVGAVGMTERAAREAGIDVRTGYALVRNSSRGHIHKLGNDGFIKVVADTASNVLVGATSVGPCGGEVLAVLTLAVHARIPIDVVRRMITAYPTFHRTVADALADLSAS